MRTVIFAFIASVFVALAFCADASAQDYKIKQTMTMSGQKMTNTTYVKGPRKRTEMGGMMGMGGGMANIEQCDLKRYVKLNDKRKLYLIEPFDTGDGLAPAAPTAKTKTQTKRGGTLTFVNNVTDTGERKQMFGVTARRLKMSMKVETSPDACSQSNMSMETDGWYIDLPTFSCPVNLRNMIPQNETPQRDGCTDRIVSKVTGPGKLGFALSETRTINAEGQSIVQSTETIEFTTTPLSGTLFDLPSGYSAANNINELYDAPNMAEMMKAAQSAKDDDDDRKASPSPNMPSSVTQIAATGPKRPGVIRIGVPFPTNRGGENISTTNMQSFLIQRLTSGNVEAVAVADEAGARTAGCDYFLTTDFSKLKQSTASRIGGMFGKVINTDTSAARTYDAQVDYTLIKLADGKSVLKNKASNKTEGDVDRAAENVLALAAVAVLGVAN